MHPSFKIPFNRLDTHGKELDYIRQAIQLGHVSGDGTFTKRCSDILEKELGVRKVLLTTSCTHALEMTAILLNIGPEMRLLYLPLPLYQQSMPLFCEVLNPCLLI